MDMKLIGRNIATLRKDNGYTQESLAEILKISPQAVSKWETGMGLPEASTLIELASLYQVSIDKILCPDKPQSTIHDFIERNIAIPESKILEWIPRISRWNPPDGCNMWYSFPAMIAAALVSIESIEQNHTEVTYTKMNERFCELMHISGLGYGFLWNTVKQHMIEELWHVNNISEMVTRIMGYYGRDYLWLTPENATLDEMRQFLKWSITQKRPVVMEWPGGIPEFNLVTGYEDDGDTLIGYTYCEECAAKTNEYGMFVNPARWGEVWGNTNFRALVIGNKIEQSINDYDTIEYALKVLDKTEADDKEFFLTHEFIAGDAALNAWRKSCDTDENTVKFFKPVTSFADNGMFNLFLDLNSTYTQKCLLPYYKKLGGRNSRKVNDIVIQIDIGIGAITNEAYKVRQSVKEEPENITENAASCHRHIENLIKHREYMRGWLREILSYLI